ncbi:hypothetical protein Tco_0281492 [Tanacetum coccineum]
MSMREVVLDLDTAYTFQFQLGGLRWIAFDDDFLGPPLSYTLIEEPLRRLCHRLIAFISLEETLTVEVRDLPTIDPDELIKLRICERVIDTVVWVSKGPPRQQFGATGGDAQIDPEHAPQMPQAAAAAPRTIAHRYSAWMVDMMTELMESRGMRLKGVMLAISSTNIYGVDIPGISIFVYDVSISKNVRRFNTAYPPPWIWRIDCPIQISNVLNKNEESGGMQIFWNLMCACHAGIQTLSTRHIVAHIIIMEDHSEQISGEFSF